MPIICDDEFRLQTRRLMSVPRAQTDLDTLPGSLFIMQPLDDSIVPRSFRRLMQVSKAQTDLDTLEGSLFIMQPLDDPFVRVLMRSAVIATRKAPIDADSQMFVPPTIALQVFTNQSATTLDFSRAQWVTATQTNSACIVTIVGPKSGYVYISEIVAGYTGGAGPFTLTVTPASGPGYAITVAAGLTSRTDLPFLSFDYTTGNPGLITITLPGGGVGITGFLAVAWENL